MKRLVKVDERGNPVGPRKRSPSQKYRPVENPTPHKKRSRGNQPQYDWRKIRDEYVFGIPREGAKDEFDLDWPTYEDLAERHGVSLSTVTHRGSKERWKNLKDQQAVEIVKAKQRKRADKIANAAVQFDDNALKVGEMGVALVMSRLGEVATEMRERKAHREEAIRQLGRGAEVKAKDLRSAVYHQEMLSLANAAEKFQQIGLRALGAQEGAGGTSVQVNVDASTKTMNVAQELVRDDKERASALVAAFTEIGALPAGFIEALGTTDRAERAEVVDAEIITSPSDMDAHAPQPTEAVPDGEDEEEYELDPAMKAMIDNMPTTNKEV